MTAVDAGTTGGQGWRGLVDRLLSSPTFHRWTTAFPLTRPIARRQTRRLFDLCAGFVYSQVLYSCVRLKLVDHLRDRPHSAAELCDKTGLSPDAMDRLLRAAISLDLIDRRPGDLYGLGLLGAALVGSPAVVAMVEHHALLYEDLSDPVALLKGEVAEPRLNNYYPYTTAEDNGAIGLEAVSDYSRLMTESHALIADEILRNYPFGKHRQLLDIGGGEGRFLQAVAARHPDLKLHLFDLPAVAESARLRLQSLDLLHRVTISSGDFARDPLPDRPDLVTVNRILHDHDEPKVMGLLRKIRESLAPGGSLLISEPMGGTAGAEPIGDAYFNFYLLAMGSGRARTAEEYREMLLEAGFEDVRFLKTRMPILLRMIVARAGS